MRLAESGVREALERAEWRDRRRYAAAVAGALAVAVVIRAVYVAASPFPLNDGGLFYAMMRDVRAHGYALPHVTSYNNAGIPFAYPPFGVYAGSLLSMVSGASPLTVLRFMPILVSLACLGAFGLLAEQLLPSRRAATFAVFAFALQPASFDWLIMGGGITRAFGQLWALLMLYCVLRCFRDRSWRFVPGMAIFASLTVLSHPEWAYFALYSAAVLFVAMGRNRAGVIASAATVTVVVALTSPWWATVVARDGLSPFLSAVGGSSGEWPLGGGLFKLFTFRWEAWPSSLPVFTALAAIGVLESVRKRSLLLPGWLVVVFIVESRGTWDRSCVPIALLAGVGLAALLDHLEDGTPRLPLAARRAAVAAIFLYAAYIALAWPSAILDGLSPDQRAAMAWAGAQTPADSSFLLITSDAWVEDAAQEWFPALTHRSSVTTVQGSEWIAGAFTARADADRAAQACADRDAACLAAWAHAYHIGFGYVYVAKYSHASPDATCCSALRASLAADRAYSIVYDGPAATIFRAPLSLASQRPEVSAALETGTVTP